MLEEMNALIENIDKLHTTEMGKERVKRNLQIETLKAMLFGKRMVLR